MEALKIIATVITAFAFAELVGYFTHILLHSNKIEFLSRSHMIHHMMLYGPKMTQRDTRYKYSAVHRKKLFKIGIEWILPLSIVVLITIVVGLLLEVSGLLLSIFVASALLWGYTMISHMHSTLHIEGYWMLNNRYLKNWFNKIRKFHDVHHLELHDDGRMNKNYGICFFFFDKLFGTLKKDLEPFNEAGFQSAQKRYAYIYDMYKDDGF
jgi:sterol desaturase/sphingolipid hydroxylase (fatty acid hydroxylase superfamily)